MTKYSKKAQDKIETVMHELKGQIKIRAKAAKESSQKP